MNVYAVFKCFAHIYIAAYGGYKEPGLGREYHKMALGHYQQTKNLLVSYSEDKLGFFCARCTAGSDLSRVFLCFFLPPFLLETFP